MADLEKAIQNAILKYLQIQPDVFAFQVNTMGVYDPIRKIYRKTSSNIFKGTPDIIGMVENRNGPAYFLGMEVKSEKGKLSDGQIEFQMRCRSRRAFYFVVRSLKDAERALFIIRSPKSLVNEEESLI